MHPPSFSDGPAFFRENESRDIAIPHKDIIKAVLCIVNSLFQLAHSVFLLTSSAVCADTPQKMPSQSSSRIKTGKSRAEFTPSGIFARADRSPVLAPCPCADQALHRIVPRHSKLAWTVQRDIAIQISGVVKAVRVCDGHQPIFR